MGTGRIIAGIDIGSTKICTAVAELDPSRGLVLRGQPNSVPSESVIRGTVRDLNQLAADLDTSFSGALYRSGLSTGEVFVAINGREMQSEVCAAEMYVAHADGEVHQEDVDALVAQALPPLGAGRVVVHSLVRQWQLDGVKLSRSPAGMIGRHLRVETHTVTGSETQVANLDRAFQRCGLNVKTYVHSLIAASEAVLSPEERQAGSVLIDYGGSSTDLGIFADGSLTYSESIPIGMQNYVNDLRQGLGIGLDEAHRILRSYGRAWTEGDAEELDDFVDVKFFGRREFDKIRRQRIYEIMQPRTDELTERIGAAIRASGYAATLSGGAAVVGGGAQMRNLRPYLRRALGREVRMGVPSGIGHLLDEYRTPAYAQVLGLLLFGAKFDGQREESGGGFVTEVAQAIGDIFRGLFKGRSNSEEE